MDARARSLIDTIVFCYPRQMNLIPIGESKNPIGQWKKYRHTYTTKEELKTWVETGRMGGSGSTFGMKTVLQFGVVTGPLTNVVVVDSDSAEGEAWCQANLPETPWMVQTCKGFHRYYQHPGVEIQNRRAAKEPKVDVRGDRGYVVAPFAIHRTGAIYTPLGDWSATQQDLPVYDESWILPLYPEPTYDPVVENIRSQLISQVPYENVLQRAKGWMKWKENRGKGNRHRQCFHLAATLTRGFTVNAVDALALLVEWNDGNTPPLTMKDLKDTLDGAIKRAKGAPGSMLVSPYVEGERHDL